jgi:hypothetical protein
MWSLASPRSTSIVHSRTLESVSTGDRNEPLSWCTCPPPLAICAVKAIWPHYYTAHITAQRRVAKIKHSDKTIVRLMALAQASFRALRYLAAVTSVRESNLFIPRRRRLSLSPFQLEGITTFTSIKPLAQRFFCARSIILKSCACARHLQGSDNIFAFLAC